MLKYRFGRKASKYKKSDNHILKTINHEYFYYATRFNYADENMKSNECDIYLDASSL